MKKEFSITNDKVLINFTAKYCNNFESLLESEGFRRVLDIYLKKSEKKNSIPYRYLVRAMGTEELSTIRKKLTKLLKWLTVMSAVEISEIDSEYKEAVADKESLIKVVEDIYLFWRRLERYTIIHSDRVRQGLAAMNFTETNSAFSKLILKLYRKVEESIIGSKPQVFRQIPVGGNCSIMINKHIWPIPREYESLEDINIINSILIETPFITYPKKNTRTGIFSEVGENPIKNCNLNKEHWFCYPAKVGELLAYVYFHRDYMEHGITLCNLFEMAKRDECRGIKPDIVYVFGGSNDEGELQTVFFDDKENDIMVGYVKYSEKIDYFGYMKKMILTLHNLTMIKRGYLPIHGAMVNIQLKDGKEANVVIMGDSGAGKSESLEAFRTLSEEYISQMTIIFDDMGTFKNKDGHIYGYGTEIGAFVRLDDLDQGYAFKEIDRSIFMNPDKINARLVMPVTPYAEIIKGYRVHLFLYANNYEDVESEGAIKIFKESSEAIEVFKLGQRMAKGTTSEKGLVNSYFANPFGPAQKKNETDLLIEKYFKAMFDGDTLVGEIKTNLGILGKEKSGPRKAALELFDLIRNLDKN